MRREKDANKYPFFRHKKTSFRWILYDTNFYTRKWCPGPDSNRHALWAGDFKSPVSTYFTTRALPNLEAEVGIEPASTELQSAA